ncbi:MAG: hypothetical protein LBI62_00905 [Candidatus Accumulibacter sp.]|jgi:hypothetical protein|nr:hypothetical protein [Accumulibacter sp.]
MMDQPVSVKRGVFLVWTTLAISVATALILRLLGDGADSFTSSLLSCAIFCVLPYKINDGSRAARVIYMVLVVFSVLLWWGGVIPRPMGGNKAGGAVAAVENVSLVVSAFVEILSLYYLYRRESSAWFVELRRARSGR